MLYVNVETPAVHGGGFFVHADFGSLSSSFAVKLSRGASQIPDEVNS